MARGRMINRKVSVSFRVNSLSGDGPFFFCALVAHLDLCGRFFADPTILKGQIIPLRPRATPRIISQWLDQMEEMKSPQTGLPLVFRYQSGGMEYLEMPGFLGEQKGTWKRDREDAEFPPPPETKCRQICGILPTDCPQNWSVSSKGKGEGESLSRKESSSATTTILEMWKKCCSKPLVETISNELQFISDDFGIDLLMQAMVEASKTTKGDFNTNYLRSILQRWKNGGNGHHKPKPAKDLSPEEYIKKYAPEIWERNNPSEVADGD